MLLFKSGSIESVSFSMSMIYTTGNSISRSNKTLTNINIIQMQNNIQEKLGKYKYWKLNSK